ncbi:MAG: PIN domain-containing protein, partial [Desulfurococcales archaeon]|nr:PIN domain-containing protein [Desulfurococcales archaeon]
LERYTRMVHEFNIAVLRDYAEPKELIETMRKYRLTPSDAIIALTCKHYSIDTILTFDEDFKRIPWLKVIP